MEGVSDKARALAETAAGFGLMSLPFWSHVLDGIVQGAHVVAALAGAVIGVNGVYRIFFRKKRRASDRKGMETVDA